MRTSTFVTAVLFLVCASGQVLKAAEIARYERRGRQNIRELQYFLDAGLVPERRTAIEQQIESFERSLTAFKEAKPSERNTAFRQVQASYEKFSGEFKAIAESLRNLVHSHQQRYQELNDDSFPDNSTREKFRSAIESGKQEELRALAAFNNKNYAFSAHLYLRALRLYARAFALRNWPALVKLPEKNPTRDRKS
ncbi:MAG: hypothetical protein N2Z22_04525 [Turneriella sp.]|nr:hypothetical protein [Turneriella sp.]